MSEQTSTSGARWPPFEPNDSMETLLRLRDEQPEVFDTLSSAQKLALSHYERWKASASATESEAA
jgi:hypothetical protein